MKTAKIIGIFLILLSATGYCETANWKISLEIPFPQGKIFEHAVWDPDFGGYGVLGYFDFYRLSSASTNWEQGKRTFLVLPPDVDGTETAIYRYGIDFLKPETAVAAVNNGTIWKTTDGGKSWTNLESCGGNQPYAPRFISFCDETNGWTSGNTVIFSTKDGGQHWNEMALPESNISIAAIYSASREEGYILSTSGYLYFTTNSGKHWSETPIPFRERKTYPGNEKKRLNMSIVPMAAIQFSDPQNGKVIIYFHLPVKEWVLFETSDGGKTWTETPVYNSPGTVYLSRDGKSLSISDKKMKYLPQKPASGGIPASDSRKISISRAPSRATSRFSGGTSSG